VFVFIAGVRFAVVIVVVIVLMGVVVVVVLDIVNKGIKIALKIPPRIRRAHTKYNSMCKQEQRLREELSFKRE
jgi:hypothetical protein